MLDAKDIEILLTLQSNPLATITEIAKAIDMSISGTVSRINQLKKVEKAFFGVLADLNLKSLGLEIHDFFFDINSKKSLDLFEEKLSYYHPYLLYRVRCDGIFSGVYMQFRIPKGTLPHLMELADYLVDSKIIKDYDNINRINEEKSVNIKSSLSCWDTKKQKWIFDWEKWSKDFDQVTGKQILSNNNTEKILDDLTKLDIDLLAELTNDARRKNVDLIRNIGMTMESGTAQRVSRRLRFLKEKAIHDYRIFLNWESFDMYQRLLMKGFCSREQARKIRNYLMIDQLEPKKYLQFPFESLYFITDYGFYWYVRAPPSHISEFNDFIWKVCPDHHLFVLDYKFSKTYSLWTETFDLENKKWRTDREFMVDNVIKHLK